MHDLARAAVSLALVDSINPCVFYIYASMLVAASLAGSVDPLARASVGRALLAGLSFASAVALGYALLGLGLVALLPPVPKAALAVVGFSLGAWSVYRGLSGRSCPGECIEFPRIGPSSSLLARLSGLLSRASTSAAASFALGLAISLTLLPCSAGPYVIFLGLISGLPAARAAPLLFLYDFVFISPLLAVLAAVCAGLSTPGLRRALSSRSREISVIGGLLLIALTAYVVRFY